MQNLAKPGKTKQKPAKSKQNHQNLPKPQNIYKTSKQNLAKPRKTKENYSGQKRVKLHQTKHKREAKLQHLAKTKQN